MTGKKRREGKREERERERKKGKRERVGGCWVGNNNCLYDWQKSTATRMVAAENEHIIPHPPKDQATLSPQPNDRNSSRSSRRRTCYKAISWPVCSRSGNNYRITIIIIL